MKVTYSAPGKIILSGEHSVVYTKPAFVTAVDLLLTVTIKEAKPTSLRPDVASALQYCEGIVREYLEKQKIEITNRNYSFNLESTIPEGRGMGSSAAFCVATVAALLHFYTGHAYDKETINTLAYKCEHHFHGMPSGVDVSASCFGGLIYYRKEFEFLKYISALNFKIPKNIQERLILIDSGKPVESTSEMVKLVGKKYNTETAAMEKTLIGIEKITKKMVVSVVKEDTTLFAECIEENQKLLVDFGIVSKQTQTLLASLSPFGVGKVTGAGGQKEGSGLILFFIKDTEGFETYKKEDSLHTIPFKQDFEGVQEK